MISESPLKRLRAMLLKHEGLRLMPYVDGVGKVTVGVGRNITDNGISRLEAMILLNNDIHRVQKEAVDQFAWFKSINVSRQDVVLNMIFNMGIDRFKSFKRLIAAISAQNYDLAAQEMLASKWAQQVGIRATELADMMKKGQYPFEKEDPTDALQ